MCTYEAASAEAGDGATYLAGAYHNSGDDHAAEPYYRLGLKHRLDYMDIEAHLASHEESLVLPVAISYNKTGRCAYLRHDFEQAANDLNTSMTIFERMAGWKNDETWKDRIYCCAGDTMVDIARLHMEQGDYMTALKWAQRSYSSFFAFQHKELPNNEYSLVDMGICHSKLGNREKAEEYLKRALALNITFNGEASIQTMRTREAIADNHMLRGDIETARSQYLELELSLEQDFGECNPQVLRLRQKRQKLEQ